MLRLSKNNRVLFIEYAGHILEQLKRKNCLNWLKGIRKVSENFYVITPLPTLPFKCTVPFFNRISQQANLIFYRKMLKRLGFADPILWITRPTQLELIGGMGEKLVVYDCVDEHSGFHSIVQKKLVSRQIKVIASMEEKVLKKADLVFTTAPRLYSTKKKFNRDTYLVSNACDVSLFNTALSDKIRVPEIMESIKHPIIGYYGRFDKNTVDFDLIANTARAYPDCSIVLIGPDDASTGGLCRYKNIHLIKEVPYKELPGYLKAFDVAIIPFKYNDIVESADTLKLYEYLAAGKSVVCTGFPQAKMFCNIVKAAGTRKEFIDSVALALEENSGEQIKQRVEAVREHTWDNRVNTISNLIEKALNPINENSAGI
jgi:hypothetical protein